MMNLQQATALIDAAMACGIPVNLRGEPGIGKTALVTALAAARDLVLEVVLASIREPADFAGLPIIAHDGSTQFAPPRWARAVAEAGRPALIFFDEISTAPPAVQAALLRVVTEGWVGDLKLPSTTRFVGAMNPVESAAGGWDLTAPLANRMMHLEVDPDANQWVDGMLTGWENAVGISLSVEPSPERAAGAMAAICGFIAANPTLLVDCPSDPGLASGAWPSPRSWDNLGRLLPRLPQVNGDFDLTLAACAGLVGAETAAKFLTYRAEIDLPSVIDVLDDPRSVKWDDRGDRVAAILNSVVAYVAENAEAWAAAQDVLRAAVDAGVEDVAAGVVSRLMKAAPKGSKLDPKLLVRFGPLLTRAGKIS